MLWWVADCDLAAPRSGGSLHLCSFDPPRKCSQNGPSHAPWRSLEAALAAARSAEASPVRQQSAAAAFAYLLSAGQQQRKSSSPVNEFACFACSPTGPYRYNNTRRLGAREPGHDLDTKVPERAGAQHWCMRAAGYVPHMQEHLLDLLRAPVYSVCGAAYLA